MSRVERLACTKVLSMNDSCYQAALSAMSLPLRSVKFRDSELLRDI